MIVDIPSAEDDLNICTEPPTAIKAMKNRKAAGVDSMTTDMLKAEETVTPQLLTKIFGDIWETEDWTDCQTQEERRPSRL